jgi:hypothetical protein
VVEVKVAEHHGHRLDTIKQSRGDVQRAQTGSSIQHQSFGARGDQVAARLPGPGGNPSTAAENRHLHGWRIHKDCFRAPSSLIVRGSDRMRPMTASVATRRIPRPKYAAKPSTGTTRLVGSTIGHPFHPRLSSLRKRAIL